MCLGSCGSWHYPDDGNWCEEEYDICCNSDASAQSPINIEECKAVQAEESVDLLDRLAGDYDLLLAGSLTNNGHSGIKTIVHFPIKY